MIMKKFITILVLMLIFGWTNVNALGWTGTGTLGDPYQISTPANLALLATDVNGGTSYAGSYFKPMNDISLSAYSNWTPIGSVTTTTPAFAGTPFSGTFNGNGKTITGLTISVTAATTQGGFGIFGCVSATGTVSNLNVTGVSRTISIASKKYVGGFIGANQGIVDSCSTSGMLRNANLGKEIEEMIDREKTKGKIMSKLLNQNILLHLKSSS
jgi:hypothetical protein